VCQHPILVEALAQDRVAERQRGARPTRRGREPRRPLIATAKIRTGWLLVEIGFRLAAPSGAMNRTAPRRQRSAAA
jgi:hypothetical protein